MFKRIMAVATLIFISGIISSPMTVAEIDIRQDPSKQFNPVIIFKDELMNKEFYIASILILFGVFLNSYFKNKEK